MIASNYRKHPSALAVQLPLAFPHRLTWHTPRPGPRVLRAIRATRAHAFAAAGRIAYPVKAKAPAWWSAAKAKARSLAAEVKDACLVLWAEVRVAVTSVDTELIGFNYEAEIAKANPYRARCLRMQRDKAQTASRHYPAGCPRCDWQWVREIPPPILIDAPGPFVKCCNCTAAWHPAYHEDAKRELNENDF